MYVRNVKQIFRAAGGFDERQYGFGGLMDLLKALQKEGFIRMERDRRGGLRVFQGQSLAKSAAAAAPVVSDETGELIETDAIEPGNAAPPEEARPVVLDVEGEIIDEAQPSSLIDTTAELLGRNTPKRGSRSRSAAPKAKKSSTGSRAASGSRGSKSSRGSR